MMSLIASVNFAESPFPKGTPAMVTKAINIRSFDDVLLFVRRRKGVFVYTKTTIGVLNISVKRWKSFKCTVMNNSQKGKAFERWDRDGVAQHRNLMHEIAMKKQITMYQREEKLLEKELREISKVKETLLQIRAPLRRRVRAAEMKENSLGDSSGTERNLRKTSVATRENSVTRTPGVQHDGANTTGTSEMMTSIGSNGLKLKPELSRTTFDGNSNSSSTPNFRQRKISVLEREQKNTPLGVPGGQRLAQCKISAPAFLASKTPALEESDKSGFLPVIKTPNPPQDCTPMLRQVSPLLERPLSAVKNDHEVGYRRSRSPALLAPLAPSGVDVAQFRAKSVPCELLASRPVRAPRSRPKQPEVDETTTLTKEETLRIKGKFRQIGHSVIATALLKGLKQKRQLSSEAIHNMHKPICLGEESETAKNDENKNGEGEDDSKEQGEELAEAKPAISKKQSFRNIARKTINVNRMLSIKNDRKRSQSEPEKYHSAANAVNTRRPKSVANPTMKSLDKGAGQEAINNSAQRKDSSSNSAGTRGRDNDRATEFQLDTNNSQDDTENENNVETQHRKQSFDVDPFRPLMNPRTAHARRRKNTLNGDMMKEFYETVQNSSRDAELQLTQADDQTTGNKSVRFATEAWS